MSRISFIVPVYNTEKYLKKCIESLLSQNIESMEILLINDGSTDLSQNIIDEFVNKFPDVIRAIKQENKGQAVARNVGIKEATGKYIAFIDSDDYVEENSYGKVLELAENENLDVLCFDFFEVIDDIQVQKDHGSNFEGLDNVRRYIVAESSPCNKIISKKLIIDNNLFFLENRIYEDFAVIPTYAKYTDKIKFVSDKIYNYVIHENSTMRIPVYNKKVEDIFYVVDKLYEDFRDTEFVEELEYMYIEHLLHAANLRFLKFNEGIECIKKVSDIMKERFPKWRKNKYFLKCDWKYKMICNLFYMKNIFVLKKILGGNNA